MSVFNFFSRCRTCRSCRLSGLSCAYGIMCAMNKCLMLFLIGCASLHSFAIDAANSYVRITAPHGDTIVLMATGLNQS